MIRPPSHPIARVLALLVVPLVLAAALSGVIVGAIGLPAAEIPSRGPTTPEPRAEHAAWIDQHVRYVDRATRGHVPLLFLGDSITEGWLGLGLTPDGGAATAELWNSRYRSRRGTNFGIGGDHVEHLLWRLRHGELDGIDPDAVVLLIGTNNLGLDPPTAIADGVAAVVLEIRRRCPRSVILLMALTPRGFTIGHGQMPISALPDPRIAEINRLIAPLDRLPRVLLLDFGDRLIGPNGRLDRALQPDFLHFSDLGYQRWAEAIEPTLRLLLGSPFEESGAGHPTPGP